jgi:hypothetical protein
MVEAVIRQGEAYAPSFYVLLAIAGLIGAVGIPGTEQRSPVTGDDPSGSAL